MTEAEVGVFFPDKVSVLKLSLAETQKKQIKGVSGDRGGQDQEGQSICFADEVVVE